MGVCSWLLERLSGIDWSRFRVVYAVLFGSAVRGCRFRDIDLAVLFETKPSLDEVLDLVTAIADATGLSEDRVDLVVLNFEQPCVLVEEALGRGVPVYTRSIDEYLDDVLRRLWVCWDFEISYRKLGLLEAVLNAVRARGGSS